MGHLTSTAFNDLRFTSSDGSSLCDYWIESFSGTTPNQVATVWIEVPSIAASPTNNCVLDQNRTLGDITNSSSKKFVANGKQLTLNGNLIFSGSAQIDATTISSVIVFALTSRAPRKP